MVGGDDAKVTRNRARQQQPGIGHNGGPPLSKTAPPTSRPTEQIHARVARANSGPARRRETDRPDMQGAGYAVVGDDPVLAAG